MTKMYLAFPGSASLTARGSASPHWQPAYLTRCSKQRLKPPWVAFQEPQPALLGHCALSSTDSGAVLWPGEPAAPVAKVSPSGSPCLSTSLFPPNRFHPARLKADSGRGTEGRKWSLPEARCLIYAGRQASPSSPKKTEDCPESSSCLFSPWRWIRF